MRHTQILLLLALFLSLVPRAGASGPLPGRAWHPATPFLSGGAPAAGGVLANPFTNPSDELSLQSPVFHSDVLRSSSPPPLSLQDGLDPKYVPYESSRHFWLAAGEVAILEFIPWALARWIRHWEDPADNWAMVSGDTWWNNLNKGWEYDGDNFLTNMFSHPYHGALFFSSGRANGYNYWESLGFSLTGSMLWEYFGETFRPAFNDWVFTGVNGSFFGEALYRLSVLITDNTATGSDRVWSEIGGALVNPVRGFTRLVTGEASRVFPNPPEKDPGGFRNVFSLGVRRLDADGTDLVKDAVTQGFAAFDMTYGSLHQSSLDKPFSYFTFGITVAAPNREEDSTGALNRVSVEGLLYGWRLKRTETCNQTLAIRGVYSYLSNPAFEFGQTAAQIDFNALRTLSEDWRFGLSIGVRGIMMGGTPSDYYVDVEGRNYDFGPGVGNHVVGSLITGGWDVVTIMYNGGWIWTQSDPSKSKHNFHYLSLTGRYPFSDRLAISLDLAMYWRQSYYEREYYDGVEPQPPQPFEAKITRRNPIGRLGLSYVL